MTQSLSNSTWKMPRPLQARSQTATDLPGHSPVVLRNKLVEPGHDSKASIALRGRIHVSSAGDRSRFSIECRYQGNSIQISLQARNLRHPDNLDESEEVLFLVVSRRDAAEQKGAFALHVTGPLECVFGDRVLARGDPMKQLGGRTDRLILTNDKHSAPHQHQHFIFF